MKKYKWDLEEIVLYHDTLVQEYKKYNDDDFSYRILLSIEMYEMMIELLTKRKSDADLFNDSLTELSTEDLIYEYINSYTKDKLPIIDSLIKSFPIFNKYRDPYKPNDIKITNNNDELVDIAYDFFSVMTPNYILEEFKNIIDQHEHIINFSYSKEDKTYGGVTICEPFVRKKFINIGRSNTLSDILALPHECFHYIFMTGNVYIVDSYNTNYLVEVEGCLANILFGEYFRNKSSLNKNFFIDTEKLLRTSQVEDLVIRNTILDCINDKKQLRMNKLNKALNYYNIMPIDTEEELKECLASRQDVLMKYTLSYLVALDLYEIYKNDQDKCFYLLKNIKHNIREDNVFRLLRNNEITFMDDGYKNLEKYLKKEKRY